MNAMEQPCTDCKCSIVHNDTERDEGKNCEKSTCCDDSCLETIARLDCNAQCGVKSKANSECKDSCCGGSDDDDCCNEDTVKFAKLSSKPPCEEHTNAVRQKYGATLEALGCICRALLALNLECCCTTKRRTGTNAYHRSSGCSVSSSRESRKAQGSKVFPPAREYHRAPSPAPSVVSDCCAKGACGKGIEEDKDSCCASAAGASDCCAKGACDDIQENKDSCKDSCYERTSSARTPSRKDTPLASRSKAVIADIEKGGNLHEHVVLNVQGLTCAGCETKLFRSLKALPFVQHVQTSLVLARAEFDLDVSACSVDEVIRSVERATGFECEKVSNNQGQHVDVIVIGDPRLIVNQNFPKGVKDMAIIGKQTVRITYDADIVGARTLLETAFKALLQIAPLEAPASLKAGSNHVRYTGYMTLLSAILTVPVLVLAWAPLTPHDILYGSISLALATLVQFIVAGPFYPSALRSLIFTHVIEMDLLIVLSTTTAYIFSVVSFAFQVKGEPLSTGEFFETSTLLVTLIMVGRFLSAFARQKAMESISIRSLQASTAILITSGCKVETEIDTRLLQYDDVFKVAPDCRVATDGVVISGVSEVDESMVTGEAHLVDKNPGSLVVAGSVNGGGTLLVRLTRLPGDNTISEIATMVDGAKFSKPKVQELADTIAGYFVPVVVAFAIVTFIIWIMVGKYVRAQPTSTAVVQALTYAISVLIVSCPCAIGLAVPMVVVIASGVVAQHGVVFKAGETLEGARKTSHVVFDKTGTLTQGQLNVTLEEYLSGPRDAIAPLVLGLTANIKHPVSSAVAKHIKSQGIEPCSVANVKAIPGMGLQGTYQSSAVRAGHPRWLQVESSPTVQPLLNKGLTVLCVMRENELLAVFGLQDNLRPEAKAVVSELTGRGIKVSIVSGDHDLAVQTIASELGIPEENVRSRCTPAGKQQYIKDLISTGERSVLFCGDGTNDAVALTQAHIGVHMSEGTDVAQSAADAVLVKPSLAGILVLIDLSKASFRRIVLNFAWAFVYNVFAILLATGALVNARVPPQYAGLGEIVSVLPVIFIAMQLRWWKSG